MGLATSDLQQRAQKAGVTLLQDDVYPLEKQVELLTADSITVCEDVHDPSCILCSLAPGKEQQQRFESLSRQLRKIRPVREER